MTVLWRRAVLGFLVTFYLVGCASESATSQSAANSDLDRLGAPAPPSPLGAYLAGRIAQSRRDLGAATAFMGSALANDPENIDLLNRTFLLAVSDGRMTEAADLAKRILVVAPQAPLPGIVGAVEDFRTGAFATAADRLAGLSHEGINRFASALLVAWAETGRGRFQAAQTALQPLDENRGFGPVRQLHAGLIHDLAGEGTEAEAAYRQALSDAQRAPFRLVQALGNFLERSGRRDEAREAYRSYLGEGRDAELLTPALTRLDRGEKPPPAVPDARAGAAEALFDLASLFNQSDTVDLAVIYARLSLALRPDFPLAQILLADLLEGQRRPAEALAIYRSVDASSPLAWNARLRAASLMESAGQGDAATTVLRQMADERPDRPDALIQLADTLRAKEKFAEAVPVYDAAVARIDASDSRYWSLFYSRAIALERSKQWGRAEGDLKRALELQPDQPYVLNYLGYSWVEQGMNLADALQLIQRAVQLRPNDGYVVDSLGWVFYRLGDVPKAVVQLERAVELRPQDPTINDHLGDAYWQSGRRDEARFQWQRALALKPDDDQVRAIEAKIAKGMDKLVPLSGASISGSGATQPASKGLGGPTSSGPTPSGPAASDPAPADPIGPAPRL